MAEDVLTYDEIEFENFSADEYEFTKEHLLPGLESVIIDTEVGFYERENGLEIETVYQNGNKETFFYEEGEIEDVTPSGVISALHKLDDASDEDFEDIRKSMVQALK